jgi:transcriptional regulator with XRE-family HTH domain
MTPAQCRAARALLGITQTKLARLAELGLSTIVDFERDRRQISADAAIGIRMALELAGVEFITEDGGGPGVRLKKSRPKRRNR